MRAKRLSSWNSAIQRCLWRITCTTSFSKFGFSKLEIKISSHVSDQNKYFQLLLFKNTILQRWWKWRESSSISDFWIVLRGLWSLPKVLIQRQRLSRRRNREPNDDGCGWRRSPAGETESQMTTDVDEGGVLFSLSDMGAVMSSVALGIELLLNS